MANSRIAFNTLNADAKLDAAGYHLKIARGIVNGFSSRKRAVCNGPKKRKSESEKALVVYYMPVYGKRGRCRCCKDIRKDLKSYVYFSTCNIAL